jgi:hypothetical protein
MMEFERLSPSQSSPNMESWEEIREIVDWAIEKGVGVRVKVPGHNRLVAVDYSSKDHPTSDEAMYRVIGVDENGRGWGRDVVASDFEAIDPKTREAYISSQEETRMPNQ